MSDLSAATNHVLVRLGKRLDGEARLSKKDVEATASVIMAFAMLMDGYEKRLKDVAEFATLPLTLPDTSEALEKQTHSKPEGGEGVALDDNMLPEDDPRDES